MERENLSVQTSAFKAPRGLIVWEEQSRKIENGDMTPRKTEVAETKPLAVLRSRGNGTSTVRLTFFGRLTRRAL
jgi:hypothetical protein